MSVTSIPATNAASGTTQTDTVANPSQTLNQNDFLQLLVTQMENQDPLNPQSDTQMAAQMAQFTSLQQSSAMSGSLAMIQANSLVGNNVTVQINSQQSTSGVVEGVIMKNGSPQIVINGLDYGLSQVVQVIPAQSQTQTSTGGDNSVLPTSPSTSAANPNSN